MISRQALYVALYLGNQALGVATTIAIIRFGQDTFSLTWCVGALVALGWGTTGYGLLDPSLSARIWSAPVYEGLRRSLQLLAGSLTVLGVVCLIPWTAGKVSYFSGIPIEWVAILSALGVFRACMQLIITYSLRLGRHHFVLGPQIAGRLIEIALVIWACVAGWKVLLIPALLAYPAGQLVVFLAERRKYETLESKQAQASDSRAWVISVIGRVLEMVLPTVWLRLGGEAVFVAYKSISAALSNSVLLPRYWYVITSPNKEGGSGTLVIGALVLFSSIGMAGVFQFLTAAVQPELFLWSLVPLTFNSLVIPFFSRWRQRLLLEGDIVPPAVVSVLACLIEACLLTVFDQFPSLPLGLFMVANIGLSLGFMAWCGLAPGMRRKAAG